MSHFNHILVPVNGNASTIEYALDMAQRSNAKLYFLKTYRLVEEIKRHPTTDTSVKQSIDEQIEKEFLENYQALLQDVMVEYELLVEVGFLSDRIIANIRDKDIDMLLLDGFNKGNDEMLIERFSELPVPVLLIPKHYKPNRPG